VVFIFIKTRRKYHFNLLSYSDPETIIKIEIMSSKSRRKKTKDLTSKIPTYTLDELYRSGDLPENYHLKEYYEYSKYSTNTSWWLKMGKK